MKRNRVRLPLLGALAISIGLVAALPAAGHKVTYDTHLQLKIDATSDTQDTYSGQVNSTRAACRAGRVVNVTHAGVTIATTTTDLAGNWTVIGPRPPKNDDVTAFVAKKILKKNRKHVHRCAADIQTHKAP
jgi:hypothetical protein